MQNHKITNLYTPFLWTRKTLLPECLKKQFPLARVKVSKNLVLGKNEDSTFFNASYEDNL